MIKYDVLYKNGKIFTSDDNLPHAQAMAVKDGKIAWVGQDKDADESQALKIVDLAGRRILPGL